jgi:tetratricopeptide (TPR) repeat protein
MADTTDDRSGWTLDERLREMPRDRGALERRVEALLAEIATARSQPAQLLGMLQAAAPLLLAAGRIDAAHRTASAAIAIAELLEDVKAVFLNQLALAKALRWEGRFELATPLFDRLVAQARSVPAFAPHLYNALFEAGANLFEQSRYREAARYFREARQLRRLEGADADLDAVTHALRLTAERSGEAPRTA